MASLVFGISLLCIVDSHDMVMRHHAVPLGTFNERIELMMLVPFLWIFFLDERARPGRIHSIGVVSTSSGCLCSQTTTPTVDDEEDEENTHCTRVFVLLLLYFFRIISMLPIAPKPLNPSSTVCDRGWIPISW